MATQHRNQTRLPLDVEPALVQEVERIVLSTHIPRTKLLRILVKFGLSRLEEAIKFGDPSNPERWSTTLHKD